MLLYIGREKNRSQLVATPFLEEKKWVAPGRKRSQNHLFVNNKKRAATVGHDPMFKALVFQNFEFASDERSALIM